MLYALSFILNTAVTFVISSGIWRNHPGMAEVYGPDTPARRILGCVYLTIGLISLYALLQMILGRADVALTIAATLFPLQIIYKLMTAYAVRLLHPVVIANLCISAFLALTLLVG